MVGVGRGQERLREPALCCFEEKGLREIELQSSASWWGWKEGGAGLFSEEHSRRMRGNGCKLLQG